MNKTGKTTKNLKIVFNGDAHEIDADVLIKSLVNYSIVAQEASAYISLDSKINIKIKAIQKGSFELLLGVVADAGSNLFSVEGIDYAASIVVIVGGLYKLKKWLSNNGEPEIVKYNNNNTVNIKNRNGNITISNNVLHIYQSSEKTREGLKKTFEALKDTEEIESFEIIDQENDEEIFHANKKDFDSMASDIGDIEQKKQKEIKIKQELSVFKIVFKENHKWEFFYKGNRIYALITDQNFINKVSRGEVAFRSGDRMVADMEIIQVFNETANVFINDEYFITKVLKHIPRTGATQDAFGFLETNQDDGE